MSVKQNFLFSFSCFRFENCLLKEKEFLTKLYVTVRISFFNYKLYSRMNITKRAHSSIKTKNQNNIVYKVSTIIFIIVILFLFSLRFQFKNDLAMYM